VRGPPILISLVNTFLLRPLLAVTVNPEGLHKTLSIFCKATERLSLLSIPEHGRFGPEYNT
jgi:hypothetical protein